MNAHHLRAIKGAMLSTGFWTLAALLVLFLSTSTVPPLAADAAARQADPSFSPPGGRTASASLTTPTGTGSWQPIPGPYGGSVAALALSPHYAIDHTAFAGVQGHGVYRNVSSIVRQLGAEYREHILAL